MHRKGNSLQITTISEVSTKKLQDMPTVTEDHLKTSDDFRFYSNNITLIFPGFFNLIGRFANTSCFCITREDVHNHDRLSLTFLMK